MVDVGAEGEDALRYERPALLQVYCGKPGLSSFFAVACFKGRVAAGTGRWDGWRKTQSDCRQVKGKALPSGWAWERIRL